jgi:hypothetical protein
VQTISNNTSLTLTANAALSQSAAAFLLNNRCSATSACRAAR